MFTVRPAKDRGRTRAGWLDSRHSFSFADYHDPRQMGVSSLRVINEDRVDPGAGFPPHGHRNMEIVSIVLDGAMQHRDSSGGGAVLRPGEVQLMHAGTGVSHSEFNASDSEPLHFLQIWILPTAPGGQPGYAQRAYFEAGEQSAIRRILDPDGRDGALPIRQDACAWQARLQAGERLDLPLEPHRQGWLQLARGTLANGDLQLKAGDGLHIRCQAYPSVRAINDAEFVFFDLV
ncbi:pirin family protein [Methylonatrum kenyense]|uniref:pirin family protein n=1 Tax=Methylonatrum kenyense TaxID=455253 RepID=UPI0020C0205E|nr:pirin family protein [Methylonatrum kenyense]MCK8517332.1 pirin family protein [Methylonatrum kenyense]